MLEGESGTMKRGSADESEPRRTYSCLLARATAPNPQPEIAISPDRRSNSHPTRVSTCAWSPQPPQRVAQRARAATSPKTAGQREADAKGRS